MEPATRRARAKAVCFTALAALCEAPKCQPGDLLRWEADDATDAASLTKRLTRPTPLDR